MVPIWKKQKSEVTDEEYASFYKDKFNDYSDPARVIVSRTEGTANYNALLFVPSHRPYDFYTKEYEKGLALYASGVLIMEKCADLLPDYFSFVKGIVDSQDLSLNISREMLQKDNQLKLIHNALEKKIKNELHSMLVNDREKYEAFWKEFGRQIKFGAYSDYGMHAELLRDLLSGLPRSRRWSPCRSMWTRCLPSRSSSTLPPVTPLTVWPSSPPPSWFWTRAMMSCC